MDIFNYIDNYTALHLIGGLVISKILLSVVKLTPGLIVFLVFCIAIVWELVDGYLTGYNGLQDSIIDVLVTILVSVIVVV